MSMLSKAARIAPRRVAGPSHAVRNLTMHHARPSVVSLGKRPQFDHHLTRLHSASTSRDYSWAFWRSTPVGETPNTSTPTTSHEPILTAPHPDLGQAATSASTQTAAAAPSTSSPLPDVLSSTPLPTPQAAELLPQSPALHSVPSLEELLVNSPASLQDILNSPEAVNAAMKVADLKNIGLEHGMFSLPGWTQEALVGMHVVTGLPWWATIAAFTIAIRVCLLPLVIRLQKHNVRLQSVQPQMNALFKRLQDAKATNDRTAQQVVTSNLQNLMKEHDVSPFRPFLLPLIQMPFFLSMFSALRTFATTPVPQMKEGGFSWVTDLTLPDPYYILPATSMLLTNLVFKTGADGTGAAQQGANMHHLKNAVQIASIIAIPFVGRMPAAVLFYWTFTNGFTLIQALCLRSPTIKKLLNIPIPPVIPPPPGEVVEKPNPNWMDSYRALRSVISDRAAAARLQAQEEMSKQERAKGLRKGTALMVEKVREAPVSTAAATDSSAAVAEPRTVAAPSSAFLEDGQESTPGPARRLSKEEVKRQRVAAARERRTRQ